MNKKEANEIKKLFTPANCAISRICGCYVDAEKNKRTELKEAFLSLPEEEAFKYFNIFRSALSGTIGKNMVNMEFPLHTEAEGGTQNFLLKLRDSQLKDDALIEEFYDKVIASYDYGENFYIILIHCAYDIPARSSDGLEMYDASDFVYEFIQCTICPVKLSKAGLCYNTEANAIQNRSRDWIVEAPETGFLFPSFTDRNTDIHSLLYYAKNPEQMPERLIDELLGCVIPMSAKSQKETFQAIVEETLGDNCDFETVKSLHESLNEILEETKDEPAPFTLDKYQMKRLLENNGASQEKLEEFEQRYGESEEPSVPPFLASNVVNTKSFEIKTADVSIKVAPDKTHLVENRMIDGRPCIVIGISEHVEINGITVRPIGAERTAEPKIGTVP
ncbi:DUF4317 domain-containing protein [Lacrimispora saccharolytica]|uniref:DUF4317 domain-containing protein n=1 Tax=Lacrimispora saccharolytica (strain ATCC 35040 / DSM 2544 / NRCC 2533 / WM1) TaxID=610130 RepID=D9R4Y6_LACSW|nr:DUF4317 domain-containing protein [Lacrimispora saccharolytica]ADL05093.1 conserved hypothetical protein [[Clostridium] saccharolyticum WM1]QRV20717.1 DUF4317 domain-containing protein [Lacrimispora saccharolytica]